MVQVVGKELHLYHVEALVLDVVFVLVLPFRFERGRIPSDEDVEGDHCNKKDEHFCCCVKWREREGGGDLELINN